jgi:hypothetical protein
VFFAPECEQCGWATYRSPGRAGQSPVPVIDDDPYRGRRLTASSGA